MDISVIVPIYGVEKYIERALVSLFTQTKTEGVEFILVNDCTKDRSFEIAREVVARYPNLSVVFVDKAVNEGLACARQTGMGVATGEYVLHIDSDDWCEPEMLEDLYNCAIDRDADIVVCDLFINYSNREIYSKQSICENDGIECAKMLLEDNIMGYVWNKLIKRSLFNDKEIEWVPNINLWEDKLITTKLFCCTDKIAYHPQAYLHYMQNAGSIVNTMSEKSRSDMISAIDNLTSFFKQKGLFDTLGESLKHSKISTKINYIIHAKDRDSLSVAAAMYPETNVAILGYDRISIIWRAGFYCASRGSLSILIVAKWLAAIKKAAESKSIEKFE